MGGNMSIYHEPVKGEQGCSVVLADNRRLFSEAVAALLTREGIEVRALASTATGAIQAVRRSRPEICLLDRALPDAKDIDVLDAVRIANPGIKVIVLGADNDEDAVIHAMAHGAVGFVHKTCGIAVLTESIRRVRRGQTVVDAIPGPTRSEGFAVVDVDHLARHLTARERECLALLVEGLSTKAMARRLGVATTTIRSHVQAILTKLGTHSRLEAAALAVRHQLVPLGKDDGSSDSTPRTRLSTMGSAG
jgi:two-component system nitrate/nitrite response regulator NarL